MHCSENYGLVLELASNTVCVYCRIYYPVAYRPEGPWQRPRRWLSNGGGLF